MFDLFKKRKKSFMETEIFEQSKILQGMLDTYITPDYKINIEAPSGINRIIIVASGYSYNCARYAAELFASVAKIESSTI